MIWFALAVAGLAASILGGVIGFGTAPLLLPILTAALGVRVAVPVLGVAMILAFASRAAFSWRDIDWKVALAYSAAAVPAAMLGAFAYIGINTRWINVVIAVLVLLVVPARRLAQRANLVMKQPWFTPLGAAVGVVTGAGGALGPVSTPFYLSYGLAGPSYIGTGGFNSTLIYASTSIVYWFGGSMRAQDAYAGLMLGALMVVGSFIGRRFVEKIDTRSFVKAVEVSMVLLGCYMLFDALRRVLH